MNSSTCGERGREGGRERERGREGGRESLDFFLTTKFRNYFFVNKVLILLLIYNINN